MELHPVCGAATWRRMKATFLAFMAMATLALGVPRARAGMGDELAATHLEKMGGLARIKNVGTMHIEGKTFIGDKTVEVVMWTKRPNLLRVESQMDGKKFVQVYDGQHPPWQMRSNVDNGAPKAMDEDDGREFVRNADFDWPLVDYAAKGFTVDYAGEDPIEGRPAFKLLVMNKRDEILFLWLDKENYTLVKRLEYRVSQGRRTGIETFYKDYRPVKGVPQPYRVETRANGRVLNMTLIDRMDANPRLPRDTFDYPAELENAATNAADTAAAEEKKDALKDAGKPAADQPTETMEATKAVEPPRP
jgi:outer membrane lipoprotein-sorting protein